MTCRICDRDLDLKELKIVYGDTSRSLGDHCEKCSRQLNDGMDVLIKTIMLDKERYYARQPETAGYT